MKVNTKSWHFKVWVQSYNTLDYIPRTTNLCSYFHRVFWTCLLWFMMGSILLAAALGILYGIFVQGFYYHTTTAILSAAAFVVIVGLVALIKKVREIHEDSEPGLVRQWLAAKKRGICPVIEFEKKDES